MKSFRESAVSIAIEMLDYNGYAIFDNQWNISHIESLENIFSVIARPTYSYHEELAKLKAMIDHAVDNFSFNRQNTEEKLAAKNLQTEIDKYIASSKIDLTAYTR
jgi:hypothetical protein